MKKKEEATLGDLIKEARENKKLTFDEFYWLICNGKLPKNKVKGWEKNTVYPNLDEIYKIAQILELNPNEMLEARDRKQKSTIKEVNPSARRMGARVFNITKPVIRILLNLIPIVAVVGYAIAYKFLDTAWNTAVPDLPQHVVDHYVSNSTTNMENEVNNLLNNT